MSGFRDAYDEFRRVGAEVVAISVDSPYCHRAWAKQLGILFPLVSDFNRELLREYDLVGTPFQLLGDLARRSAFVIDAGAVVRYAWYQPEGGGLPVVEEVLAAAQEVARTDASQAAEHR